MIDMFIVRERERESRYREIQLLQQLLIVRDINYTEFHPQSVHSQCLGIFNCTDTYHVSQLVKTWDMNRSPPVESQTF